jgi:hypothetical protein
VQREVHAVSVVAKRARHGPANQASHSVTSASRVLSTV